LDRTLRGAVHNTAIQQADNAHPNYPSSQQCSRISHHTECIIFVDDCESPPDGRKLDGYDLSILSDEATANWVQFLHYFCQQANMGWSLVTVSRTDAMMGSHLKSFGEDSEVAGYYELKNLKLRDAFKLPKHA
jgi:hypothetical protein